MKIFFGIFSRLLCIVLLAACAGGSSNPASVDNIGGGDGTQFTGLPPVGNQAAPGHDSGPLSPEVDPTKVVLLLSCGQASCVAKPKIETTTTESSEECTTVTYKFTGHIGLSTLPEANFPEWNGWTIRMVNQETQRFFDFKTKTLSGRHGSFKVEVTSDLTPHITFHRAPLGTEPVVGEGMLDCGTPCVPEAWKQMEPLFMDSSCDFLQSPSIQRDIGPFSDLN